MRSKTYCINITPIPWQRIVRKSTRIYDNDTKEKVSFLLYLAQQHNDEPFFDKPVHLDVTFFLPIPKSGRLEPTNVPYLDNLYKFLLYSMKDILISDDR